MLSVAPHVDRWISGGHRVALATVIATRSSAPRPVGSHLAVCATGETVGAVSGGCVEGAVRGVALEVLAGGPPRVVTYGAPRDELDVGLPCGGEVDVLVELVDPAWWGAVRGWMRSGRPFALRTPLAVGGAPDPIADPADRMPVSLPGGFVGRSGVEDGEDGRPVFVEVLGVRPRLVVVGADDLAAAVCAQASALGWVTTVVDARDAWATPDRLPAAAEVVVGWPGDVLPTLGLDGLSAVVVMTHEDRFDVPALVAAVRGPAFYVGALGSRAHHAARRGRLEAAGLRADEVARILAPTGLDLGAETPAETALAIVAEILAVLRGRGGGRLSAGAGRIHGEGMRGASPASGVQPPRDLVVAGRPGAAPPRDLAAAPALPAVGGGA